MNQSPEKQTEGLVNFFKIAQLTAWFRHRLYVYVTDLAKRNWFLKECLFIFQKILCHRCYGEAVY